MSKPAKTKSVKKKIIIFFILVSILPLLVIAVSNLYLVIKTRQQNITELQNLAIDNADDKIIKYLNEKSEGLNLVVSAPVNSLHELPADTLYSFLMSSYNTSDPIILNFIDTEGHIIAKVNEDKTIHFLADYLTNISELYPDNYGMILENNVQRISKVEADVKTSKDFLAAIKGEEYVGPLEFLDDKAFIRLASPIVNQHDEIIGAVAAEIEPTEIGNIVESITVGNSGYLYVLEESGRAIASGNKKLVDINKNLKGVSLVEDFISGKLSSNKYYPTDFTTYKNPLAIDVVFLGKKMDITNWYIISEWPITDAFAVIQNILLLSLFITFFSLVITILIGLLIAKQIIRPIKSLYRGTKHISEGDYDYRIRIKTGDEFEFLGNKFNDMIKLLKENQKLRDEFVFIAAHELRTPVTAIKGYVSMILDGSFGDLSPKVKENLLIVNKANNRLVQLVQDLLEVARSDAGKMKIEMGEIDIVDTIKSVSKELDSLTKKKNIVVKYEPKEEKILVRADAYKLNEVLVNIIGNAIKYTLKSSEINISHERDGEYLIMHIKDQGIGMSKEAQENLFSKFYRVQTDETKDIEGTGLGLFICKEIMERMEGDIWVKSEKGKGSVFSFKLKIVL